VTFYLFLKATSTKIGYNHLILRENTENEGRSEHCPPPSPAIGRFGDLWPEPDGASANIVRIEKRSPPSLKLRRAKVGPEGHDPPTS